MNPDPAEPVPVHRVQRYPPDLEAVVGFLGYIGSPLYSQSYFSWKLEQNPFGPGGSYLRFRDGAAAAHCSITPKPANDRLAAGLRLAELGDTHTHPSFQRQGHFASLGKHVIEDYERRTGAPTLVYGLPNEQALPGWTRSIGCSVMENLSIRQMVRTPQRGIHPSRILASIAGRFSGPVLRRLSGDDDIRRTVGAIWSATKDGPHWLLEKTPEWVSWRYQVNPAKYDIHALLSDGGAPTAWIASRTWNTRYPGIRRVAICDVVALDSNHEVAAFDAFMARVPRPTDVVHGWFQPETALWAEMPRHGFVAERDVPVIFASNSAYQTLRSGRGWFRLSLGDSDNI